MPLKPYTTFWKREMEFILAKKKRTILPLIGLLIYLSIVPMQLSNYVLCIGANGHVAFEVSTNGQCADARNLHEEHMEVVIASFTPTENHCGSCIDLTIFVPLNAEPYLIPAQNALISSPPLVVALVTYQASDSTIPTYTPLLNTPSIADPTLISLRTTTLLI